MFCQHMCWAPSICVMGPRSGTYIPLPLPSLCPGNQYSQGSHWGRAGEKVPCAVLGVWYPCVLHVCVYFYPASVYMCQHVFVSVLHKRTHANPALS